MRRDHAPDTRCLDPAEVRARLVGHRPRLHASPDGWQAATAVVVAPSPAGSDVAFIRRAERRGDRWSGQMALPGGTRDDGDADLATTAVRETREEVGLELPAPVARLDDQRGRLTGGTVASFVFVLGDRPPLAPDPREVSRAMWIGLGDLLDPAAATRLHWAGRAFPAIAHGGEAIWGLTHRIVAAFAAALGTRLPEP